MFMSKLSVGSLDWAHLLCFFHLQSRRVKFLFSSEDSSCMLLKVRCALLVFYSEDSLGPLATPPVGKHMTGCLPWVPSGHTGGAEGRASVSSPQCGNRSGARVQPSVCTPSILDPEYFLFCCQTLHSPHPLGRGFRY